MHGKHHHSNLETGEEWKQGCTESSLTAAHYNTTNGRPKADLKQTYRSAPDVVTTAVQAEKQDAVEGEGVPAAVDAESGGEGAPHRAAPCTISHHAVHCSTALPHSPQPTHYPRRAQAGAGAEARTGEEPSGEGATPGATLSVLQYCTAGPTLPSRRNPAAATPPHSGTRPPVAGTGGEGGEGWKHPHYLGRARTGAGAEAGAGTERGGT